MLKGKNVTAEGNYDNSFMLVENLTTIHTKFQGDYMELVYQWSMLYQKDLNFQFLERKVNTGVCFKMENAENLKESWINEKTRNKNYFFTLQRYFFPDKV